MDEALAGSSEQATPVTLAVRPKIGPLQRQSDFSRIYKQGRRYRTGLLTLVAAPGGEGSSGLRVAFVVSKKVAKSAVRRNRVRRRLREAFRHLLCAQPPNLDLIVITHRDAAEADYWQLHAALAQTMQRLRLCCVPEAGRPSAAIGLAAKAATLER